MQRRPLRTFQERIQQLLEAGVKVSSMHLAGGLYGNVIAVYPDGYIETEKLLSDQPSSCTSYFDFLVQDFGEDIANKITSTQDNQPMVNISRRTLYHPDSNHAYSFTLPDSMYRKFAEAVIKISAT
jgi:hypothetical protein